MIELDCMWDEAVNGMDQLLGLLSNRITESRQMNKCISLKKNRTWRHL